ncbi:MAG TPA: hypothetical protein VFR82_10050, partial [Nitrospira sp.]|nr:hypothetical protein [Nitrospira sp.]
RQLHGTSGQLSVRKWSIMMAAHPPLSIKAPAHLNVQKSDGDIPRQTGNHWRAGGLHLTR